MNGDSRRWLFPFVFQLKGSDAQNSPTAIYLDVRGNLSFPVFSRHALTAMQANLT